MQQDTKTNSTGEADGALFWEGMNTLGSVDMMKQLDAGLKAVVRAVMETGEKGKLTLTLEVMKSKMERQLIVKPQVKVSKPSRVINSRVVYADKDNALCVEDPAQGQFDFDAPKKVVIIPAAGGYTQEGAGYAPKKVTANNN